MSSLLALLFAVVACDTGPSAEDMQKGVESAMAAKDYPAAITKADNALKNDAIAKDAAKAWRFESMRLEALAAEGKGDDVTASLQRLQGAYAKQLTPALYRSLADKLQVVGDGKGAILVLDAGLKRFPEDPSFQASLDDLKKSDDPAELEMLKTLGYIDK